MTSADIAKLANAPTTPMKITIPNLKVVNPLNSRQHWHAVSARGKREKNIVALRLMSECPGWPIGNPVPKLPCVVTLTRVYGKRCRDFDSDSVPAAMKHVRDSVAAWIGTDDGPRSGIEWKYAQQRGAQDAVTITIEQIGAKEP